MQYGAVLLAAGKGERFKGAKQDLEFHGKAMWKYPYGLLQEIVDPKHLVVVGKDIPGGHTRSHSVRIGLNALPEDTDRVIIVEAARPMVTHGQLLQLLEDPHPSVSFVKPLVDTVVFRNGNYLNRDELYDLLTPQAFDYRLLKSAYAQAEQQFENMTDETRVMFEAYGIQPFFIETGSNLYKVTYPEDITVLEFIYRTMEAEVR